MSWCGFVSKLLFFLPEPFLVFSYCLDGRPTKLSDTATITVKIGDVNEVPTIEPQTRKINENSAVGININININTTVNNPIVAADVDETTTGTTSGTAKWGVLEYAIVSGSGASLFKIGKLDGQLKVNSPTLNYEPSSTLLPQEDYQIGVEVTDGGGLTAQAIVTIKIIDVNERPTLEERVGEVNALTILENSAKNTEVTTNSKRLVATDPDGRCPTSSGECMSIFSLLDTIC